MGGITADSLFEMARNVAEARRILQVAPFDRAVAPGFRVESLAIDARAGRVVVRFQGASGGGIDPASLSGNVALIRRQSPLRAPRDLTLIGTPTVLPDTYRPVGAADPTANPTIGVVFDFGRPLPRGNYRFLIRSGPIGVRDLAGRPLDGEFRRTFPSGDGVPGGDLEALLVTNGVFSYRPKPALGAIPTSLLARRGVG